MLQVRIHDESSAFGKEAVLTGARLDADMRNAPILSAIVSGNFLLRLERQTNEQTVTVYSIDKKEVIRLTSLRMPGIDEFDKV